MKNVSLLGKGSLAIKIAKWLEASDDYVLHTVVADKPEPTWAESLEKYCKENTSASIVTSGDYRDITAEGSDVVFSVFYGKIIKQDFIHRCKHIVNLHNAPLPKYRGVRPINWALKNNETEHGVTIHKISEGIDDGDILGKITYPIYPEVEEVEDVYNKALDYGYELFKDVFKKFDYAYRTATPQGGAASYYSNKDVPGLKERQDFRR